MPVPGILSQIFPDFHEDMAPISGQILSLLQCAVPAPSTLTRLDMTLSSLLGGVLSYSCFFDGTNVGLLGEHR